MLYDEDIVVTIKSGVNGYSRISINLDRGSRSYFPRQKQGTKAERKGGLVYLAGTGGELANP
jgi:hypothetical protein